MSRRLLAVVSCHKYALRVQTIRETWGPLCAEHGFDLRFFVGRRPGIYTMQVNDSVRPQLSREGFFNSKEFKDAIKLQELRILQADTIQLDVDDDYLSLPKKVQALCSWTLAAEYEYMCKLDDDCYVVPSALAQVQVEPHHYVGRFRSPLHQPAWYASGFAYWLDRFAMTYVANTPVSQEWAEDRWIGNLMAYHGIQGHSDLQNYAPVGPTLPPAVVMRSNVKTAAVFCEFPDTRDMLDMHARILMFQRPHVVQKPLTPVPFIPVTAEALYAPPVDAPQKRYMK